MYADGATITYEVDDTARKEICRGVFSRSANTLTRATLLLSSSGGFINWPSSGQRTVRPLIGPLLLCDTPPTIGQVLEWDGTEWCPATLPPPVATFPLCPTPPTNGQVLIWDAINNEWCPADFCTLVAACMTPTFAPGAVTFDGSAFMYNFPAMADSPTGSMSFWIYIPSPQPAPGFNPSNVFSFDTVGPLFGPSAGAAAGLIVRMAQGFTDPAGGLSITNITSANPAVITFSGPHGIIVGSNIVPLSFGQLGTGWTTFGPGNWENAAKNVTGVGANTVTVNFDTSAYAAYSAVANPQAHVDVFNSLGLYLADANNVSAFTGNTTTTLPVNQWVNVEASWDMNHAAGSKILQLFHGDSQILVSSSDDPATAFSVGYSSGSVYGAESGSDLIWALGGSGTDSPGGMGVVYIAEAWFAPGQFIDFTNSANRAKFHDAMNAPVDLGTDGSTPTGSAPALYQHIDATAPDPYINLGFPIRVATPDTAAFTSRNSNFTNGITSSHLLTFSVWVWGESDTILFSWSSHSNNNQVSIVGNLLSVSLADSTGGNVFLFSLNYDPGGAAVHTLTNIRVAVDTNHAIGAKIVHAYVNNTDVSGSITILFDNANNLLVDWTAGSGGINAISSDGFKPYSGFLGALWIAPDQFFDPGAFFIDGSGNPTSLGLDGSTVTGTAPSMYFNITGSQAASAMATNLGSGGAFTLTGTFRLLPNGASFCKNYASSTRNMILNPDIDSFDVAPTHP